MAGIILIYLQHNAVVLENIRNFSLNIQLNVIV